MESIALLLLLSLSTTPPAEVAEPLPVASPAPLVLVQDDFNDQMKAAGDDAEKLWALYQWTQEDKKRSKYAKRVLIKLLKVDPEHAEGHAALGHTRFDDQWFETDRELETYKKKRALELGLVDWKGEWVEPDDLPYLRKGLQKDSRGLWFDPEVKKKLAEGWVQQDLVWIAPDEKANVEKGLWKCGTKWLSLEEADEFHSYLGEPWIIPDGKAVAHSFASRATAQRALAIANQAYFDVSKATGTNSDLPVPFALTRDQEQFLKFCDGDEEYDHPMLEPRALSTQLRATYADLWFDFENKRYLGMGATFWDPAVEHADKYAINDVRMAYGLSFMETLDPATKAIDEVFARKEVEPRFVLDRINGRQLPEWIHFGVAAYTSRWFIDTSVGQGGNPNWAPQWSATNIRSQGNLDPLNTILEFQIAADNTNTNKLVNEAGLLVAFCVDGKDVAVTQKWNAVFDALRKGGDVQSAVGELRKTFLKSEDALRAFAKL